MEGLIWLHENLHGSNAFNHFVKIITMLGDGGYIWLILACILLLFKKTRISAIVMLISLGIGSVLNEFVIKQIVARPRPFETNPDFLNFIQSLNYSKPSGFSFPSGHTFSSFNCAMILTLFNKKMGYFAFPLATVIGLSRIFMCVHYPTDVLCGMIFGIITAVCVFAVYLKILQAIKKSQREKIRHG